MGKGGEDEDDGSKCGSNKGKLKGSEWLCS